MTYIMTDASHEEQTLDEEINSLIAKHLRGGLTESEFARFQHLTAQRSLSRRPRYDKRMPIARMRHASA